MSGHGMKTRSQATSGRSFSAWYSKRNPTLLIPTS